MKINIKFPKLKKVYKKDRFVLRPVVFWHTIIIISMLLICLFLFVGYDLFKKVQEEQVIIKTDNNRKMEKEKKERINTILEYFNNREKKSLEIINSPAPVVDPVL